jgi:predicted N-acyltransferase
MNNTKRSFHGQSFSFSNPFESINFYQLLEESNLLNTGTVWEIQNIHTSDALLPGVIKSHRYGEYIFDWEWANFFHQNGHNYYPKLIHTTPFTPVNASKILGEQNPTLYQDSFEFYQKEESISSEHYLFISDEEEIALKKLDFSIMHTIQYHFSNKWSSFTDFLSSLKQSKRKMIRKERKKATEYDLDINWLNDLEYTEKNLEQIYLLYLSTIVKKNSQAYLNKDFFIGLKDFSSKNRRILVARKEEEIIAMSIFFESEDALYGRYWGIHPNYQQEYNFLHFEMCYYRGIEYTIDNNLKLFEAGAQGEQKLIRGFIPVIIKSAHHIKNQYLFTPIKEYITKFNQHTLLQKEKMSSYLPYKDK